MGESKRRFEKIMEIEKAIAKSGQSYPQYKSLIDCIQIVTKMNDSITFDFDYQNQSLPYHLSMCLHFCTSGQYDVLGFLRDNSPHLLSTTIAFEGIEGWIEEVAKLYCKNLPQHMYKNFARKVDTKFIKTFGFCCHSSYIVVDSQKNGIKTISFIKCIHSDNDKKPSIWLVGSRPDNYCFPLMEHNVYLFILTVSSTFQQ